MTPEQIDNILGKLRQKMSEEDDEEEFARLRETSKQIRVWYGAGGKGEIPHRDRLQEWGILTIDLPKMEQKIQVQIEEIRKGTEDAFSSRQLLSLNRLLGEAQFLQAQNNSPSSQIELDQLVESITQKRNELRHQLGQATTLGVLGNYREAYRQAKEELDGFLGEPRKEVEPFTVLKTARARYLNWLKDLINQRLTLVQEQEKENPLLALDTLEEANRLLSDEVLTKDDLEELKPTRDKLDEQQRSVKVRLGQYEQARQRVLDAQKAGTAIKQQLELYIEAQQFYAEYPQIQTYIEQAKDAIAAVQAGEPDSSPLHEVEDELALVQQGYNPYQKQYDEALVLLQKSRCYAAQQAFKRLLEEPIPAKLQEDATRSYDEATEKLAIQTQSRVEKAVTHAQKQPKDYRGQRKLWNQLLEINPESGEAQQALRQLDLLEMEQKIQVQIEEIRKGTEDASSSRRLPALNRLLGEAQSLQAQDNSPSSQIELDKLVEWITQKRNELRHQLGQATTLGVSGNYREAYRRAKNDLDIPVVYDEGGFLGEPGKEVEPFTVLKTARTRYLNALKDLINQRLTLVQEQEKENPLLALDTLEEANRLLSDEVLTKDDLEELKPTRDKLDEQRRSVKVRREQYEQARQRVLEAQKAGIAIKQQLELYIETQQLYPEYPQIQTYIEQAKDAIAAVQAGELENQMAVAMRHKERDDFDGAFKKLQDARQQSYQIIPDPKPYSSLFLRLQAVKRMEDELASAERDYNLVISSLKGIDDLFNKYEQEKNSILLADARVRLDQINTLWQNHPQVAKRRDRLGELQGVEDNWEQGRAAYVAAKWTDAINFLRRVARSEVPEKRQAEQMIARAEGAQEVSKATQAEEDRKWKDALNSYQKAFNLFEENGSDPYTSHFQERAQLALGRLRPLQNNDVQVEDVLRQVKTLLDQAAPKITVRTTLLEKLEPVEAFSIALQKLTSVRELATTLGEQLEGRLQTVRQEWRRVYLEGMRAANNSTDRTILERGKALGATLDQNGLLYEESDKTLWRSLQERWLDAQFQHYERQTNTDLTVLTALEQNRQERLNISIVQTDDLKQQYLKAIENRVLFELGEEQKKGLAAAKTFLSRELNRVELYSSPTLFREMMHLLWEMSEWEEAQKQANHLKFRRWGQETKFSDLWLGLTTATKLLQGGDWEQFQGEIQNLRSKSSSDSHLHLFIEKEESWLKEWQVNSLVEQASQAVRQDSPEGIMLAAQRYAQAQQINTHDARIETGLKRIYNSLQPILQDRCKKAQNFQFREPIPNSLREAKQLLETLKKVEPITKNRWTAEHQEIEDAITKLTTEIDPWKKVYDELEEIEREKNESLTHPNWVYGNPEGGWQLQPLITKLNTLISKNSTGTRSSLIQNKKKELDKLEELSVKLNELVQGLHQAWVEEEFDRIIEIANQLQTEWTRCQQQGFAGLEQIVQYTHPFQVKSEPLRTLPQHIKRAQLCRENYTAWEDWATVAQSTYKQVTEAFKKVNKPLDELRENRSLQEIRADCDKILKESQAFQDALGAEPETPPLSQKAVDAKNRFAEKQRQEVSGKNGIQTQTRELLQKIEAEQIGFEDWLRKLQKNRIQLEKVLEPKRNRWGRERPLDEAAIQTWLRNLNKTLEECKAIDPLHSEVISAQKYYREINGKYGRK